MVDELRTVLELATEDELQQVTKILFSRRLNPIDYLKSPDPLDVQSNDLQTWLDMLENRFRFLAADGITVLRGQTKEVCYRDVLIQVCRYLKIPYSQKMTTIEIESEIFLNLLQQAWRKLPSAEQKSLKNQVINSLAQSPQPEPLPLSLQHDPVKILLQGGSLMAVSSILKPWLLQKIAQQFAIHFATYQVTKTTIIKGGIATASQLQNHFALQMAKRGMVMSTARYTAVRGVFAFLGPVLWGCFLADLGWRAIATNYTRIIPVIFTLAQIRLTRGYDWEMSPC
ncbi:YaaW family protein [Geminocystis sp. NIES-3709]|uniref:YaaW family protein n=1 Tax=Geminocystis sp. NIES-3709 TaxID=1617448 RepID=UPI0008270160|nr:YaaW family protein [Geminocystis sp. NIES-3709]